jgi:hypothetical protein
MALTLLENGLDRPLVTLDADELDRVKDLVTQTDDPVDNLFSLFQMFLLVEILRRSWTPHSQNGPVPFLALCNVGIFENTRKEALVPDVLVKLGVPVPQNHEQVRSYFLWEFGPPTAVVEVVSNRKGNELGSKLVQYAKWRIPHYVVMDPYRCLGRKVLRVYKLEGDAYRETSDHFLGELGLGVKLWEGDSDGLRTTYLRWCDRDGVLLRTGAENNDEYKAVATAEAMLRREAVEWAKAETARANAESARADAESARADAGWARANEESARANAESARANAESARANAEAARANVATAQSKADARRAEAEARRAEALAAKLRALGIDA